VIPYPIDLIVLAFCVGWTLRAWIARREVSRGPD
jgi:hypothetical protein